MNWAKEISKLPDGCFTIGVFPYSRQKNQVSDRLVIKTGEDSHGKAYASLSFKNSAGEEERWKTETINLKYKEYVSALIDYDKRADEAMLSAVGLDPSISSVTKDDVISNSEADVFYKTRLQSCRI
jgi:hypothetical protein